MEAGGFAGSARGLGTGDIKRSAEPSRAAECLRLYPGGYSVLSGADGARRRRPGRLDGYRHADRRVLRPAEAALQLLQAEFRSGHQSADRSDPRTIGDVADL